MWITLFSAALAAAVCLSVTAVVLQHTKHPARVGG
jgi:hypothetical protein